MITIRDRERDVAAHAGVGVGTVYRRFASKEELVDGLFDDMVATIASYAEQGLADPDPVVIQLMVAAVTDHTGHPDLWRRYLRLLLDGMRARPDTACLPSLPADHGDLLGAIGEATVRQVQARSDG